MTVVLVGRHRLSVAHRTVLPQRTTPPGSGTHPGPVAAIGILHADIGITLALGLVVAIPTVAPLAAGLAPAQLALVVLAVGAGSLFFSHVNDAGFSLVVWPHVPAALSHRR